MPSKINSGLLVFGGGGHGKVVADAARSGSRWNKIAFVDDRYPDLLSVGGWPVVGRFESAGSFRDAYPSAALGIGSNIDRARLFEKLQKLGFQLPTILHPDAIISPDAVLAAGTVVFARAVVNINAVIGAACIINTGAIVEHDCSIGYACHISPASILAGGVSVGSMSWVGIGAVVRHGISIGDNALVGAGAVVVKDVANEQTVVGVPAKPLISRP